MPNAVAYMMLLAWPLVSLVLFRRLPLERAILWCIIAGYLLLPPVAEFDLPLVPDMDKFAIPSIMAFGLCTFMLRRPVPLLPRHPAALVLVLLFVFGVIPTVLTNGEPMLFHKIANADPILILNHQLPGLRWRDVGSVMINQVIVLMPFLIARRYLSTPEAHRDLLLALVLGALAYSIPALFEIRFSPQTNVWVYGFFQHDFSQMIRMGGYRPIVFLPHALWLAFFVATALMAAAALARTATAERRWRLRLVCGYLFLLLIGCKSLASLAYGLVFTPVVAFAPLRWQLRMALVLGLIAVIYPMLRNAGLIPTDDVVAYFETISVDRAHSLGFRFDNEAQLLARAAEKPWFGWGGWGRNLILHEESGEILSIPDGRWIIVFGTFGWLGYIAEMGLLALPLVLLAWAARKTSVQSFSPYAAPIALILAATLVDMLLNATLIPITWMCAGAVLGYAERLIYPGLFRERPALFGGIQAMSSETSAPTKRSVI